MHRGTVLILAVVAVAAMSAQSARAAVVSLAPGASASPVSSTDPVGGTVLQTTPAEPFSSAVFSGTLVSSVISGDTSNAQGGLTFTYKLTLNASSSEGVSDFIVSSFDSFNTDLSYNNSAGGIAPGQFVRSNEGGGSGKVLHFSYLSSNLVPGQSTAILIVQTNASQFQTTTASVADGSPAPVVDLAPMPVPEPGLISLGAIGALFLFRRSRRA